MKKWSDQEIRLLVALIKRGDSYGEIAERFGVSRSSISSKALHLGIQSPNVPRGGRGRPVVDVAAAHAMRRDGATYREIAASFGVSGVAAFRAVRRASDAA